MGTLIYASGQVDIPDRPLDALQDLLIDRLDRGERFTLTLQSQSIGERSFPCAPELELAFRFRDNHAPNLGRARLSPTDGTVDDSLYFVPGPRLAQAPRIVEP
ncbi:hypothetical protein M3147_15205 [Agromyces mediolanus]|uniref:DUF7882 family protein n=1 Tax=Agromyces mediolanus TaxID=41986 RepID=UPI00203DAD6A|nr:hypothetical protein [Agromyces mediolanus]MCM3658602.1 hypothetical protein [Agromyces mediolanus]